MLAQRDGRVITALPGIGVPVLIVVGDRDEPFLGAASYMAAKIPQATLAVIPDAGHASNIDQPDRFNEAVLDFLGRL
jgi:pimeloyl-ACP methyl ester carboxylesterase